MFQELGQLVDDWDIIGDISFGPAIELSLHDGEFLFQKLTVSQAHLVCCSPDRYDVEFPAVVIWIEKCPTDGEFLAILGLGYEGWLIIHQFPWDGIAGAALNFI